MQQAYPQDTVARWTTDQHRLGRKPMLRRVWCRRGQRPQAVVQHRYQWCDLDAFVHPSSGRTVWLLLPTVSMPAFTRARRVCPSGGGWGGEADSPGTRRGRVASKPRCKGLPGCTGTFCRPTRRRCSRRNDCGP